MIPQPEWQPFGEKCHSVSFVELESSDVTVLYDQWMSHYFQGKNIYLLNKYEAHTVHISD